MMQASLAILGGLFGLFGFFSTFDWRWLLGAVVLLANWPFFSTRLRAITVALETKRARPERALGGNRRLAIIR